MPAQIRKTLRVGLVTTIETNIGDDFIREALLHVIARLAPGIPVKTVTVNKHDPGGIYRKWHPIRLLHRKPFCRRGLGPFQRAAEHWLAPLGFTRFEKCDLILQCGTPVMWEGCRNSEWSNLIWRDVLLRLARKGIPVLNIGGGSCYPWERLPSTLVGSADEKFIRLMLRAARLTTVRDSLARNLFASLGHRPPELCCPAILTGQMYSSPARPSSKIAINFMRGGGHYDWGQGIDDAAWESTMRRVVGELGRMGYQPLLIAHNPAEAALAAQIWPEWPCVHSANPREYFSAIGDAVCGIFNRLHASVAAAGLGVPSISIGTDSRNLMVREFRLPAFYVKEATADRILSTVKEMIRKRDAERDWLLDLRESTLRAYEKLLDPFVLPLFVN